MYFKLIVVDFHFFQDDGGKYIYRYLFVELDDFGRHPIMFEDNRITKPKANVDSHAPEFDISTPLNMNLNFPDAELK